MEKLIATELDLGNNKTKELFRDINNDMKRVAYQTKVLKGFIIPLKYHMENDTPVGQRFK